MAKKRRTSNVQRQRASAEALSRRIDQGSGSALPDWRLLLIGGVIVVGVLILVLVRDYLPAHEIVREPRRPAG